jgi:hypothetical protein
MKLVTIVLVAQILFGTTYGQTEKLPIGNSTGPKNINQQVVLRSECREKNGVRLRLVNDTSWAVSVSTFSMYANPFKYKKYKLSSGPTVFLLPEDEEISSLFYWLQKDAAIKGKRYIEVITMAADNSAESWIAPGKSVYFRVENEYMDSAYDLYVKVNYEWELKEGSAMINSSTEHRIYYPGLENEGVELKPCKLPS